MRPTISASQLARKLEMSPEDVELIDVRTPVEFRGAHARGARNVPLDQLDPAAVLQAQDGPSSAPIFLICQSGSRARQAADRLEKAGAAGRVVIVEGGTEAWIGQGLPVVQGKKTMSLERQVRIAAGSLVLIGSLLSIASPYCIVVPAFVGAGLVFAGITDTCGMGMLLAKMPWNRVRPCAS